MSAAQGKVCVVTGAVGGIGMAMCTALAREGATVVMASRDPVRAKQARDEVVRATGNDRVETVVFDMASLASIRKGAAEIRQRFPKIDVLINNAAVYSAARKTTADGFELLFGTNHLGHFLLTNLLEAPLMAAGNARVVVMAMPTKNPIPWDDLQQEKKYDALAALGISKTATLLFTKELALRWKGRVTVNAVHPGLVKSKLPREAPLPLRIIFALFGASHEKGAVTPLYAALSPEVEGVTSQFFIKSKAAPFPKQADDSAAARRLWDVSASLVRLSSAQAA